MAVTTGVLPAPEAASVSEVASAPELALQSEDDERPRLGGPDPSY